MYFLEMSLLFPQSALLKRPLRVQCLQDAIRERGTLNVNNYSRGIQTEILSSFAFLEAVDSDNF